MNERTLTDLLHAYRKAEPNKLLGIRVALGDCLEELADVRTEVVKSFAIKSDFFPDYVHQTAYWFAPGRNVSTGRLWSECTYYHASPEEVEEEIRYHVMELFPEMRPTYVPMAEFVRAMFPPVAAGDIPAGSPVWFDKATNTYRAVVPD